MHPCTLLFRPCLRMSYVSWKHLAVALAQKSLSRIFPRHPHCPVDTLKSDRPAKAFFPKLLRCVMDIFANPGDLDLPHRIPRQCGRLCHIRDNRRQHRQITEIKPSSNPKGSLGGSGIFPLSRPAPLASLLQHFLCDGQHFCWHSLLQKYARPHLPQSLSAGLLSPQEAQERVVKDRIVLSSG